jgi:hypothetical protein
LDKDTIPCSLDFPFTCSEIKKGIRKLKNGKKEGPDLILNEFIKTGSQTMTLTLVKLFNKILQCGKFPSVHSLKYINLGIQMIVITIEALVSQAAWVNYLLHCYKKRLGDFLES